MLKAPRSEVKAQGTEKLQGREDAFHLSNEKNPGWLGYVGD